MKRKVFAIITAAGMGKRLKGQVMKQFRLVAGKPVVARTLDVFDNVKMIDGIILTVPEGRENYCRNNIIRKYGYKKSIEVVPGGARRQASVFNALKRIPESCSIVVIHDGVRPFITGKIIEDSIRQAEKYGASMAAVPLNDTIKKVNGRGIVQKTLNRENVWLTQTPQTFRYALILAAHREARKKRLYATDDAVMVERLKGKVKIVRGDYRNIKITSPEDLELAGALLGGKSRRIRYGIGYDVHKLVPGRKLVLGGVRIPFKRGLLGHSDGDALLHSVCDAVLGSLGEKDIGVHFPNTDKKYKDISSLILLKQVSGILSRAGYVINNLDSMVIAEEPKLSPYVDNMRKKIAVALKTEMNNVDVKATTNEGLGLIGKGRGIAAYSVVSVIEG